MKLLQLQTRQPVQLPAEKYPEFHAPRMLRALQVAYRKHVLRDDSVGWNELEHVLEMCLVTAMGHGALAAFEDAGTLSPTEHPAGFYGTGLPADLEHLSAARIASQLDAEEYAATEAAA